MQSVRDVQIALRRLGYDPGPADGIQGRRTIAAIKAFQRDQKLHVDGVVGAVTLARLFPGGSTRPEPAIFVPWYAEASRLMGTREIEGPKHSSVIMGWAERLGLWYPSDETAWCGLFVAHCIGATLPNEPLPANPLGARNWTKFGRALQEPASGAVAVFWRGSKTGWQGHVGFVAAVHKDDRSLLIRGGNQGNSVSDAWLSTDRLLSLRWPSTAALPLSRVPVSIVGGELSTDEA